MIDKTHNSKIKQLGRNRRRKEMREYITSLKKNGSCLICGESRDVCLEYHHTDRKLKSFDVSSGIHDDYSFDKIKKEISKCILVCANCHRILHIDDKGINCDRKEDDTPMLF